MFRILIVGLGLLVTSTAWGEWERAAEVATGVFYNQDSSLVVMSATAPSRPFLGQNSYYQLNVGSWGGPYAASFVGFAKGLQWGRSNMYVRLSSGGSLISATSERLSTSFQFYEQLMVHRRIGRGGVALSYRHWSNAGLKKPNLGMDFIGLQIDIDW